MEKLLRFSKAKLVVTELVIFLQICLCYMYILRVYAFNLTYGVLVLSIEIIVSESACFHTIYLLK